MIAKLKTNKPLTENDIDSLEEILWKEIGTKQDYENEIGKKPLGEFVREIVGLDMNAAKEAFSAYCLIPIWTADKFILSIRLLNILYITEC
mgnify:FL=1